MSGVDNPFVAGSVLKSAVAIPFASANAVNCAINSPGSSSVSTSGIITASIMSMTLPALFLNATRFPRLASSARRNMPPSDSVKKSFALIVQYLADFWEQTILNEHSNIIFV